MSIIHSALLIYSFLSAAIVTVAIVKMAIRRILKANADLAEPPKKQSLFLNLRKHRAAIVMLDKSGLRYTIPASSPQSSEKFHYWLVPMLSMYKNLSTSQSIAIQDMVRASISERSDMARLYHERTKEADAACDMFIKDVMYESANPDLDHNDVETILSKGYEVDL